jgi:glycosyltransferase involved in cell wall biosynthesis
VAIERIFHIPNMIQLSQNEPQEKNHQPLVIGAMGRFVAKKGFKVLLQALAIIKSRGIKFACLLAGDGEESHTLKALASTLDLHQEVKFIGWVDDKQKFYQQLDIFCLPSLDEPFGIVLLEAMSYTLPIVSTNTVGPLEIFSSPALLAKAGDALALAEKLIQLLQNQDLRTQLGNTNYQTVQAYSLLKIGGNMKNILAKINADNQGNKKYSALPV